MLLLLGIEGSPFITRFKTKGGTLAQEYEDSIEGSPFITRFKTK